MIFVRFFENWAHCLIIFLCLCCYNSDLVDSADLADYVAGDSVWPPLLSGMRTEVASDAEDTVQQSASHRRLFDASHKVGEASSYQLHESTHRLNDSGIELVGSANSSSASDSWLAQVALAC